MIRQALVLVTLLGLLVPPVASAETAGVTRTRLPNGMTVVVRENPVAPLVAYSLLVKMGTRTETPLTKRTGLAHILTLLPYETLVADTGGSAWLISGDVARSICWTIAPRKAETRADHVRRVVSQLKEGSRRPCCWIGCIHRTDKPISPSVRAILSKGS